MKIKRAKKAKKLLNWYRHNFGHRPPFQILIDGTFCNACLEGKVNIREQLPKYLGEVKLLTTRCCIEEAEALMRLDPKLYGVAVVLKQFAVHKCGHDKERRPAAKCIKSMLGTTNSNRYFVASQDQKLRKKCHGVPGTPVLYLHGSAPTLERPSGMSASTADQSASDRMISSYQSQSLQVIKKEELGESQPKITPAKKKKRKGKNPLSCLKSKKLKGPATQPKKEKLDTSDSKSQRRRVRKRKTKQMNNQAMQSS